MNREDLPDEITEEFEEIEIMYKGEKHSANITYVIELEWERAYGDYDHSPDGWSFYFGKQEPVAIKIWNWETEELFEVTDEVFQALKPTLPKLTKEQLSWLSHKIDV